MHALAQTTDVQGRRVVQWLTAFQPFLTSQSESVALPPVRLTSVDWSPQVLKPTLFEWNRAYETAMRASGRASAGTLRDMVVRFVATHGSRRPMKD